MSILPGQANRTPWQNVCHFRRAPRMHAESTNVIYDLMRLSKRLRVVGIANNCVWQRSRLRSIKPQVLLLAGSLLWLVYLYGQFIPHFYGRTHTHGHLLLFAFTIFSLETIWFIAFYVQIVLLFSFFFCPAHCIGWLFIRAGRQTTVLLPFFAAPTPQAPTIAAYLYATTINCFTCTFLFVIM